MPVSALAAGAGARNVLVCSQSVTLVDVASGDVVKTFAGHARTVTAAAVLPDGRFVTGGMDEFLCVWEGEVGGREGGGKVKRRKKMASAPICTLQAPEGGVVSLGVGDGEGGGVVVAAVLRGGSVAVWTEFEGGKGEECAFVVKGRGSVFGVVVVDGVLSVVYGNSMKPSVWSVRVKHVEDEEIFLPEVEKDLLVQKKGKDERKARERLVKDAMALEGSAVAALPVKDKRKGNGYVVVPGEGDKEEEDGTEKEEKWVEEESGEEGESEEEGEKDEDDGEPSIQQKLLAMGVTSDGSGVPQGIRGLEGDRVGDKTVLGSRVRVLLQAVQSQDTDLFNRTIDSLKTRKLIRSTIERLPSEVACGKLLDMLVERLRQSPAKAELLGVWIREVLLEHTGALITQRRNRALTALISIVTERICGLEGLSRLEGRLELVVGQAERLKRAGQLSVSASAAPQAEYEEEEEGSEDEDEDEDEEDDSSEDTSGKSGSGDENGDGEDETGDFSGSSESSDEEESDEDMTDITGRNGLEGEKRGVKDDKMVKMNGKRVVDSDDSDSEESSDDGD